MERTPPPAPPTVSQGPIRQQRSQDRAESRARLHQACAALQVACIASAALRATSAALRAKAQAQSARIRGEKGGR